MHETTLKDHPIGKTLRVRNKTLLFFGLTSTEGERILAFAKAPDRIAVIVERNTKTVSPWIGGHLIWGNAAKLLKAHDMLEAHGIPRISIDDKRLGPVNTME